MKAVDNRVIVKIIKKNEEAITKIGNIEIPDNANEYETAEIVSVGPNVPGIEVGEKAYIYTGSGKKFRVKGEEYRTISLSEIIVIL